MKMCNAFLSFQPKCLLPRLRGLKPFRQGLPGFPRIQIICYSAEFSIHLGLAKFLIQVCKIFLQLSSVESYLKSLNANKISVPGHLGETRNCWLPLEEMTSNRNRLYDTNHPEFHAYFHPEIPDYDLQIPARDNVLAKYPDLVFVGAYLVSLEWALKNYQSALINITNFKVDISSRLGHLQIQSAKEYEEVRDFFMKYADRIIYGTDAYNNPEKLTFSLVNDWKFLSTDEGCEST